MEEKTKNILTYVVAGLAVVIFTIMIILELS